MHCLLENRVYALLPWVERRLQRAIERSDTRAAFSAVGLMDRLRLMEISAEPAVSRREALDRIQRLLRSN
jgi:hypothetical protein